MSFTLRSPAAAPIAIGGNAPEGPGKWLAAASLMVHAGVVALLMLTWSATRVTVPDGDRLDVEVLTPEQFDALLPRKPVAPDPAPPPERPPPPDAADRPSPMIEATTMLSGRALADPRSRQAREALRGVDGEERMVQLCDLEAMEQIQMWKPDYHPDRVVPYATAEVRVEGDAVVSDGAAFRSEGNWYALAFRCDLSGDHQQVAGFRFSVGEPIPRREWPVRNLPADG